MSESEEIFAQSAEDYRRIEAVILLLEQNFRRQPSLSELAEHVHLSEYHFQRLFKRWAGISPKRFIQFLTLEYAKGLLAEAEDLLSVTYDSGLSSPGRLHDLFITHEAVTPGAFKRKGAGVSISYGFHATPFGNVLLAVTERGICGLEFVPPAGQAESLATLKSDWPEASFHRNSTVTRPYVEQIFQPPEREVAPRPLPLFLKGTNFQIRVWKALLAIPPGSAVAYQTLAQLAGQPAAARAVGHAVARNPIGFLIPCHRVIRKVGKFGDYRWGSPRKQAILGWEASRRVVNTLSTAEVGRH